MDRRVDRHEIKFLISTGTARLLQYRLPALLHRDEHAGPGGSYFIRSVYFDDLQFSAYNDKLAGVKDRVKYRLRYYDFDEDNIFFEKKVKNGDLTGKSSCPVRPEDAESMLRGGGAPWQYDAPLLEEFALLRKADHRPVVVVDYDRYAFTWPDGNVRVTIDTNVRTSPYQTDFFDRRLLTVPALDPGEAVLEVKYDAFLPAPVWALLEGVPKQRSAVSKYVRCLSIIE